MDRLLLAAAAALALAADAPARPNVLVFLADDQGWGDLSVHGNTNLRTPHIDGLARDGALFEHFYVCPVCSPTRAEFLTGRYHPRGGVFNVSTGEGHTVAEVFDAVASCLGISPEEPVPVVPPNPDDIPAVVLDPSYTSNVLGWTAKVGFSQSIARVIGWYDAHGVSTIHSHLQPVSAERS